MLRRRIDRFNAIALPHGGPSALKDERNTILREVQAFDDEAHQGLIEEVEAASILRIAEHERRKKERRERRRKERGEPKPKKPKMMKRTGRQF